MCAIQLGIFFFLFLAAVGTGAKASCVFYLLFIYNYENFNQTTSLIVCSFQFQKLLRPNKWHFCFYFISNSLISAIRCHLLVFTFSDCIFLDQLVFSSVILGHVLFYFSLSNPTQLVCQSVSYLFYDGTNKWQTGTHSQNTDPNEFLCRNYAVNHRCPISWLCFRYNLI